MLTTDLGACEWFVWDLRRSNLIDRGQLDQTVGEFLTRHPGAEPPALADFLVKQKVLTQFQADRLLQGKTQGFVLGPFTLMDALGSGSMGTVYKAQSKNDGHCYAVKVLPRRSMWNVRIARRKVRTFDQCKHPAVVPFVDVGTAGGMHYLAWPLVQGESLEKIVLQQGKLSPTQAAAFALQAAEGLEVCHRNGLFHGLLKPSNLMLGADGQMRILDFGIGCLLAETEGESLVDTMSTANSVASGLDCASPESIMDPTNLTVLGDQYSLGCVLYFCLTGRYPFPDGTAVEKMMAHQTKQPTSVRQLCPEAPEGLVAVVERLMQKAPEARFPNTTEVVEALRPFAGSAQAARPASRLVSTRDLRSAVPTPSPSLQETPRPAPRPTTPPRPAPAAEQSASPPRPRSAPNIALPTRHSLSQARPTTMPAASVPTPVGANPIPPASTDRYPTAIPVQPPKRPWDERMGPLGIALCAVLACVVAWFLTYKLF